MKPYATIIEFLYNARPDQFEIENRPAMVPYDPKTHPELPVQPGELVPLGELETIITRWNLPDPQPTLEELEPHEADALAWKQAQDQQIEDERLDLVALLDKIETEVAFLDQAIPLLADMSTSERLTYLTRIGREVQSMLKAFKFLVRRMS